MCYLNTEEKNNRADKNNVTTAFDNMSKCNNKEPFFICMEYVA